MDTKNYEALIIGFGKGGKTLAQDLARQGKKVALIEKSPEMYGGTCINVGCIPTKSLVHNAKFSEQHPEWTFEQKAEFYRKSILKKKELVSLLRQKNFDILANNPNISVITGEASFLDSKHVAVKTLHGEDLVLTADKIFINTGSTEFIPLIKGIDSKQVFTSKTLLDYDQLPQSMCIVGGGYIGLEFASMYASFGTKVTVLEFGSELIAREDRDIAEAVQQRLEKRGVKFIFNANTLEIRPTDNGNVVIYEEKALGQAASVEAEITLIAVGRRPNIQGLNLDAAGIEITERKGIKTNEYLQTSQSHIWAMGDVVGKEQFTYISLDDSRIVFDFLNGNREKSTLLRYAVPYSVFIDPPMSRVGLSEKEAKAQGLNYAVAKLAAAGVPRARLLEELDGLLKIIVNKDNGEILGCTLFCADSHEMINIVSAAMKMKAKYTFLRDFIFTHPTMSESLNDLCKQINL